MNSANSTLHLFQVEMESVILLLAIVISCGGIISAFPLQQADMSHENEDGLPSGGVNPAMAVKSTEELMQPINNAENTIKVTDSPSPRTHKNGKAPPKQKRFRRSFGIKTKCIPVEKIKCQTFKVKNIEKNFCVKYTEYICTALD